MTPELNVKCAWCDWRASGLFALTPAGTDGTKVVPLPLCAACGFNATSKKRIIPLDNGEILVMKLYDRCKLLCSLSTETVQVEPSHPEILDNAMGMALEMLRKHHTKPTSWTPSFITDPDYSPATDEHIFGIKTDRRTQ